MTDQGNAENKLLLQLLSESMKGSRSSVVPALSMMTSLIALVVAGATAYQVFISGERVGVPLASVSGVATTAPAPLQTATAPALAGAAPIAPPISTAVPPGNNVRVAQSGNGTIYAFDPNTLMAFSFTSAGGATPLPADQLPADVRETLVTGVGQPTSPIVSAEALAAQSNAATAALRQTANYELLPPLNDILDSPDTVASIVSSLDMAQGIFRPGADPVVTVPQLYVFFDPQCPYCKRAYAGLDGQFAIKWLPVSTLGPAGDRLHSYIMADVTISSTEPDGEAQPTQAALFSEDAGRAQRFADVMSERATPPEQALTEGQRFVLDENGELFRLLSRGAEDMRAVPTFFILQPDGRAVWLRGFADNTAAEIQRIVSGGGNQ